MTNRIFVVGLTGGIGSGKTAVSDCFAKLGIDIIDADITARTVVKPCSTALEEITRHFGQDILEADGCLNRAKLRQIVFSDATERQWLEALLHPLIAEEISHNIRAATSPYCIFVSPLLLESGQDALCDRVLVIDTTEALQIQRATGRDNNNEQQIRQIIASQIPRQARLDKADDVINNNRDLDHLEAMVRSLHNRYLQLAAEKSTDDA